MTKKNDSPMPTRRQFLRTAAVGATALPVLASATASPASVAVTPPARDALLARHRNLFNGDTCVYFYNPEKWQPEGGPFSAKAIHRYVDLTFTHNNFSQFRKETRTGFLQTLI